MEWNARIRIEIINDYFRYENWGVKDLADSDTYYSFLLAFGNGIIEEARIVAETKVGILIFANLLERGGFRRGKPSDGEISELFQAGDVCYPEDRPFVFISPTAENGETVDFDSFQSAADVLVELIGAGDDEG